MKKIFVIAFLLLSFNISQAKENKGKIYYDESKNEVIYTEEYIYNKSELFDPTDDIESCISEICKNDIDCIIESNQATDINLIGYSKEYDECMEGKFGDNQMIACNNEEYVKQDKMLNEKYNKIMHSLPKNERILFNNYQKKWVKTKKINSFCSVPPIIELGTMHYLMESIQRLSFVNERVNQLEQCLSAPKISRSSKGCEHLYPLK